MKHYSDDQLLRSMESLVQREREILSEVLRHLKEIDRRKLFSKLGYSSLYDYAMKHLKYSGDQAHRRISAMRLLRDLPQFEGQVIEGTLSLSILSQAQAHFRKVEHSREEKAQVLIKLQNTTKREAEKILSQHEPEVRYGFAADKEHEEIIERLRGLHPHLNFDELMKKICKLALEKLDPAQKKTRSIKCAEVPSHAKAIAPVKARTAAVARVTGGARVKSATGSPELPAAVNFTTLAGNVDLRHRSDQSVRVNSSSAQLQNQSMTRHRSRYISVEVRKQVWQKANSKCECCGSRFALEVDHIEPFALGGTNNLENLRLLCRSCNLRNAVQVYGPAKVSDRSLPFIAQHKSR